MNISFFGLSHLGLNYLAASASKGFKVVGYDENKNLIKKLQLKKKIFQEPLLFENLKKFKKNITFTNNINDLKKSKIIFISSDVETNKHGKSDVKKIKKNISTIKSKFKNKNLIILSQVKPGFTSNLIWNKSKLFYQVETLVFGEAFKRALNPERIILGVDKTLKKINAEVQKFYRRFNCPIIKTDYNTAEIIKISINLYLISSISTTNLLSSIVKKINGNWPDLESALRLDKRIGKYAYLKPGLGISGGNLERDLFNISGISKQKGISNELFEIFKKNSINQKLWPYKIYRRYFKKVKGIKLGILGLAYKKNTNSIKNSPSLELIKKIKKNKVFIYDPIVKKIRKQKNVIISKNTKEVINNTDILFIMTPWDEFKKIDINIIKKSKIKKIVDPFGLLLFRKNFFINNKIKYYSLI